MQWCGLKLCFPLLRFCNGPVTTDAVVWIEMLPSILLYGPQLSPLMQWCGLKLRMPGAYPAGLQVTTDAVVWIEILIVDNLNHLPSRPPLIQ